MPHFTGVLKKMHAFFSTPIQYYLEFEQDFISMNQLIGKEISITHTQHYQCLNCQNDLPIYAQGYCKNCYFIVPQTNQSIFRPELSTAHLGIENKNLEWEKKFELQPHVVYIAITGTIKVGVTRKTQIPTRWIDQGASQAIIIAETENRYEAGQIEIALAKHMADKTNYKKMLTYTGHEINLIQKKKEVIDFIPKNLMKFFVEKEEVVNLTFPLNHPPLMVDSIKLNKVDKLSGRLIGIKGQYLIFENGKVFNVRGAEGFVVLLSINE